MVDFFNPAGRGTGIQGSINAVNSRIRNADARKKDFLALDEQRKGALFQDARMVNSYLKSGQTKQALDVLSERTGILEQMGADTSDTKEIADFILNDDIQGATDLLDSVDQAGVAGGYVADPIGRQIQEAELAIKKSGGSKSAKMREVNSLIKMAERDPEGKTIEGKAALIELGLVARVSKTAAERIAGDPALAENIVKVEGDKAAAKESGKLKQQLIHKPAINEAVKLAESDAKERGEVLTSLQRSEAALPGLNAAVSELKELAQISTSTFGGKLFDAAVKQSGFGATKGATARTKFIAIINNQVLPLLKETFGAAFTVQEGESLKATMGDPDASVEEKMAQLDAFVAQKVRDIETKKLQLGQPDTPRQPQLSDEDLIKKYGG